MFVGSVSSFGIKMSDSPQKVRGLFFSQAELFLREQFESGILQDQENRGEKFFK